MKTIRGKALALGLLGLMLLQGCSLGASEGATETVSAGTAEVPTSSETDQPPDTDQESETGGAEPMAGGDLVVAQTQDPSSLHPYRLGGLFDQNVAYNIYSTLVEYDLTSYDVVPALAASWDVNADGTLYTFELEEGVQFHDGVPMTSEDAKWSIEQAMNPESGRTAPLLQLVTEVRAPAENVVEVELSQPDRNLLATLVDVLISPNGHEDFEGNPVGTGPYKFESWDRNESLKLVRNDTYWRDGLPYLDSVTFVPSSDASRTSLQLRQGEVHIAAQGLMTELESLAAAGIESYSPAGLDGMNGFYNINVNTQNEPWDDVRVRQAASWALDRTAIAPVTYGYAPPVSNPFEVWPTWFNESATSYTERDLEQAQQLMADAGFNDGVDGGEMIVCPGLGPLGAPLGQLVQAHLAEIGINVEVTVLEGGAYVERTLGDRTGDFDLALCLIVPKPSEYDFINHLYSKLFKEAHGWYLQDESKPFFDLLDQAAVETDDAEYERMISELQALAMEGQPQLILAVRQIPIPVRPEVQNFLPDVQSRLYLEEVGLGG